MKEALSRYEDSLRMDNVVNAVHLKDHNKKIELDADEICREKEMKFNKQRKFKD